MPDRQGAVLVGVAAEALGHEELARHAAHRGEHALVRDPSTAQLLLDHLGRATAASLDGLTSRAFAAREARGLAASHPSGEERQRDRQDVPAEWDEREEADEHAERAHVRADAEPRRATAQCAYHDGRGRQRPEHAADGSGHRLGGVADQESDRAAEDCADDRGCTDPEAVRPRIPVIATESPSPRPRQRPIVYQLPTRMSVERATPRLRCGR